MSLACQVCSPSYIKVWMKKSDHRSNSRVKDGATAENTDLGDIGIKMQLKATELHKIT